MEKIKIWTDEKGKKVQIFPFFSEYYVDEEAHDLSARYRICECDGESHPSTMGKTEIEYLAAKILWLAKLTGKFSGFKKEELEKVAGEYAEGWYVDWLISKGFLREKWIMGILAVFPTKKLLENQKISKYDDIC